MEDPPSFEPRSTRRLDLEAAALSTITLRANHDFDADAGVNQPIDTTVHLITPERVMFSYPLAGPARRALAYFIDALVISMLIGLVSIMTLLVVVAFRELAGVGVLLAFSFFVVWGYGTVCEGGFNGQTIGKRIVGLRVMTTQGVPITGSQAAIRNLLGTVDGPFPFLFLPGFLSMILTRRFQRLGDLAAGTMVIIEEVKLESKMVRVEDQAVLDLIMLLPMRVAATSDQARALSDYVKHRGRFGPDLREEIAQPLAGPIRSRFALPDASSGDAVLCAYYHRLFLGD